MIIMVAGKKRSGKDYVSRLLQRKIGNIEILAFADEVKNILAKTFEISVNALNDYKNSNEGIYTYNGRDFIKISDFRKLLQKFATDAMQNSFGSSVWADIVRSKIKKDAIISDFRFIHEYNALKDLNPITIYVQGGEKDTHISEHDLDNFKFDFVINNIGKNDLSSQIDKIVKQIKLYTKV